MEGDNRKIKNDAILEQRNSVSSKAFYVCDDIILRTPSRAGNCDYIYMKVPFLDGNKVGLELERHVFLCKNP